MISELQLENFKAIGERQRIRIRPITLLFGPNSAGKSSVIQALHFAREVLTRKNLDVDRSEIGGRSIELGGFRNLLHRREQDCQLELSFELDLGGESLTALVPASDIETKTLGKDVKGVKLTTFSEASFPNTDIPAWVDHEYPERTVGVQMRLSWSAPSSRPLFRSMQVSVDGTPLGTIEAREDGLDRRVRDLNLVHPWFRRFEPTAMADTVVRALHDEMFSDELGCVEVCQHLFGISPGTENSFGPCVPGLVRPGSTVPDDRFSHGGFYAVLGYLFRGPSTLLADHLGRVRYLGPLRDIPSRGSLGWRSPDASRWAEGMGAWDALASGDDQLIDRVNAWITPEGRLNTGYRLQLKRFRELSDRGRLAGLIRSGRLFDEIEDLQAEFEALPLHEQLVLEDLRNGMEVLPQDVGVGISQVIPVVVAAIAGGSRLVLIEQPELHIHPAMQVALGDLFVEQSTQGEERKTFIIETHSEHLILRLLRRIRETTEGELPPNACPLTPEQVSVIWVEGGDDGTTMKQLEIDETGEFIDRWPRGFFEERAEELF